MATKPASLPVWNTDATNRTTPSAGKQAAGLTVSETPSSSFQNWWQNLVYQWALYLNNGVFDPPFTVRGANANTTVAIETGGAGNAGDAILNIAADGNQQHTVRSRRSLNRMEIIGGGDTMLADVMTAQTVTAKGLLVKHETTGDMADGFGAGLRMAIQDTAAVENEIAAILGVRDGGDTSGHIELWTKNAGTYAERVRITKDGHVDIGAAGTAAAMLGVLAPSGNIHAAQMTGNGTGSGANLIGGATGPGALLTAGGGGSPGRGALALAVQATPSAPNAGDVWYDANTRLWVNNGTSQVINKPLRLVATSNGSASPNSTTYATFTNSTLNIASNFLRVGSLIRVRGMAVVTNNGGAAIDMTIAVRFGAGTTLELVGVVAPQVPAAGSQTINFEFTAIIQALSATVGDLDTVGIATSGFISSLNQMLQVSNTPGSPQYNTVSPVSVSLAAKLGGAGTSLCTLHSLLIEID